MACAVGCTAAASVSSSSIGSSIMVALGALGLKAKKTFSKKSRRRKKKSKRQQGGNVVKISQDSYERIKEESGQYWTIQLYSDEYNNIFQVRVIESKNSKNKKKKQFTRRFLGKEDALDYFYKKKQQLEKKYKRNKKTFRRKQYSSRRSSIRSYRYEQ
jgi:hypothetical protein